MNRNIQDQHPDYVLRRLDGRSSLSKTLLVEGVLCAVAIGLLVLVPAMASDPSSATPSTVVATHRVCTPSFILEEFDEAMPSGTAGAWSVPPPACATSAPHTLIVRGNTQPTGSFE
ncbi:hypothetical protein [Ancylobacter radicis]|uniref:Uncharacterized protein n=1 Tax=Ancylobacter radicis TaxID=2836179 RepID=A0ABS5RDN9_9HYPH|nr:hypothetical protein [Ancylobacter radicis]MBS9478467.1 hypothetical protein [Ancylobacter radicis]